MKKVFFLLLCWSYFLSAASQALVTGSSFPKELLVKLIRQNDYAMTMTDLQGKLIILDFWSTHCGGCIAKIPEINELQFAHKDKVQFVMINPETVNATKAFFEKRKNFRPVSSIPLLSADTVFAKLFPHDGVPMHVWIDSSGAILKITNGTLNAAILSSFLAGIDVKVQSYQMENEIRRSLFEDRFDNQLKYYSYLGTCLPYLKIGAGTQNDSSSLVARCMSVKELYQMAYGEKGKNNFYGPGRLIMEVSDSFPYFKPEGSVRIQEWEDKFSYNYHLFLPTKKYSERFRIMQEDLSRYFGMRVTIEERMLKCIVLMRTSNAANNLATKGGQPEKKFYKQDLMANGRDNIAVRYLRNQPYTLFSRLIGAWIEYARQVPFKDETGIIGNIDFRIGGDVVDSPALTGLEDVLEKYGLKLTEKYYPISVLIVKED